MWYHMEGVDVMPIRVFTKTASNGRWQLKRTIERPAMETLWTQAVVPLVETQNFAVRSP